MHCYRSQNIDITTNFISTCEFEKNTGIRKNAPQII